MANHQLIHNIRDNIDKIKNIKVGAIRNWLPYDISAKNSKMSGPGKKKKKKEQGIESKELEIMEFMVHYIPDHCTCSHAPF